MVPTELAEQVRAEVKGLKDVLDRFVQTYRRLCAHHGGPEWQRKDVEVVFYHVRHEIIPIMEEAGLDHKEVQAVCAWAEKRVLNR